MVATSKKIMASVLGLAALAGVGMFSMDHGDDTSDSFCSDWNRIAAEMPSQGTSYKKSSRILETILSPFQTATTIDLSENPYDFSPVVAPVIAQVQEALAANQKVILTIGEEHTTSSHIRLSELIRDGLQKIGVERPVIAREMDYNFLETIVSSLYSDFFAKRVGLALSYLKEDDPDRYHQLQALHYAAYDWPQAPVTVSENMSGWRDLGLDIRLIDMASTDDGYLDVSDFKTKDFIEKYASSDVLDHNHIDVRSIEGMRLRNLWMAMQILEILRQNQIVILQTGLNHIGGTSAKYFPYSSSLHGIFSCAAQENITMISIYPEAGIEEAFQYLLSPQAQKKMNNSNMFILRGENIDQYDEYHFSIPGEIQTLSRIFQESGKRGKPPRYHTVQDFYQHKRALDDQLNHELGRVADQYVP